MAESPGSALQLKNVLLFFVSIVFSVLVAEAAVRYIDGYPMLALPLGTPEGSASVDPAVLDKFPLAAGVDRKWFFSEPPPLPNRRKTDPEWQRLFHYIEDHNVGGMDFRPADVFKAWNSAFAGDPCKHKFLRHAPGMLYLYDPPDGEARPPYRYMPDATQPTWLVTSPVSRRASASIVRCVSETPLTLPPRSIAKEAADGNVNRPSPVRAVVVNSTMVPLSSSTL